MWKNYFKTAIRTLWNQKFYTLINIMGLSIGLACSILLLTWVKTELSYDQFHKDHKQIYLLSSQFKEGATTRVWGGAPGTLRNVSKSISGVQFFVRTRDDNGVIANKAKTKTLSQIQSGFVDVDFFKLFNFPAMEGNPQSIFGDINSVAITESLARRLYGAEFHTGQSLIFHKKVFIVTSILKDFPQNSSIRYDALFSLGVYAKEFTDNGGNGNWKTIDEDLGNFVFKTYIQLLPGTPALAVSKKLSEADHKTRNNSLFNFGLQPLDETHLISADGNDTALKMVGVFIMILILILAIAGINYINLSAARSLIRAREVSIRKIIGAEKRQLFNQFIVETSLVFLLSTLLASLYIFLLLPFYQSLAGKILSVSIIDTSLWFWIALAIGGTFILSAIYPAILISSFNPLESLKGKFQTFGSAQNLRKVLVIFQFTISIILVICTLVMSNQMTYLKNKDLGYDKSFVFQVPLSAELLQHIDAVKSELRKSAGIQVVSLSNAYDITNFTDETGDLEWSTKAPNQNSMIVNMRVDHDFIPTLKIKLVAGVNFTGTPSDTSSFIVNQAAIEMMGLKPPYLGTKISLHKQPGTLIGITTNFVIQSLRDKVKPLILSSTNYKSTLFVRTTGSTAQLAIKAVENLFRKYPGEIPFTYSFVDAHFETLYKSETQQEVLLKSFAGIAIFISCLGLFALTTYNTQIKRKEIGIRKVLGSSVVGVIGYISREIVFLVLIATVLGIPIAWWAMHNWLLGFAYRTDISIGVILFSALLIFLVAFSTVGFQALRAARANPIKSLRTE